VLQKEAVVQKDPTNARAWYELGVKQQENEREKEAIQALQRAVEHDPSLSEAWLAVAVSYTNESQPGEAYDAIEHWMGGSEQYRHIIANDKQSSEALSTRERCNKLVEIMMAIIRSSSEVDANTQVALAVLLNTIEVGGHRFILQAHC
jgi:peroxin-5